MMVSICTVHYLALKTSIKKLKRVEVDGSDLEMIKRGTIEMLEQRYIFYRIWVVTVLMHIGIKVQERIKALCSFSRLKKHTTFISWDK